jgi:hypothetical protein
MLLVIIVAGCTKNSKVVPGCPLKACTDIFVSIGVTFTDNNDQPIAIENLRVIDLSSHLNLTKSANSPFWALGYYVIADDGDLKKLSADGDNIQVSATDPATKQTKTVIFKIAGGGCNCHVFKVSGPNRIAFN